MLLKEFREFIAFLINPRAVISSSDLRTGSWRTATRNLFVVFLFVLLNIALLVRQRFLSESVIEDLPFSSLEIFLGALYALTLQFLIIVTSLVFGYIFALILLSRTTHILQSLRSLLYAGGGFLILHVSVESAMPNRYWPVLNSIRLDFFSLLGTTNTRDYMFSGGGGLILEGPQHHDLRINIFGTGMQANYRFDFPVIVEMMMSLIPVVLFALWMASILYFFYLIYLDARLNHNLSPVEGVLAIGVALGVHVVELATMANPLRYLHEDSEHLITVITATSELIELLLLHSTSIL